MEDRAERGTRVHDGNQKKGFASRESRGVGKHAQFRGL